MSKIKVEITETRVAHNVVDSDCYPKEWTIEQIIELEKEAFYEHEEIMDNAETIELEVKAYKIN